MRRIFSCGNNRPGTTVYLGSRESERFVRIYNKHIDGVNYERLEIEFKGSRAEWIMKELAACPISDLPQFLNGVVCGQIKFARKHEETEFFFKYNLGSITVPAPSLYLDVERSIATDSCYFCRFGFGSHCCLFCRSWMGTIASIGLPIVAVLVSVTGFFAAGASTAECEGDRDPMRAIDNANRVAMENYKLPQ